MTDNVQANPSASPSTQPIPDTQVEGEPAKIPPLDAPASDLPAPTTVDNSEPPPAEFATPLPDNADGKAADVTRTAKAASGKERKKPKRARPRRRAAEDDEDEEDAGQSDDSLTSASGTSDEEDEEEDEEDEKAVETAVSDPVAAKKDSAFPTVTPVGWADAVDEGSGDEVSFEAFNRGELPARGGAAARGRGRGRGGKAEGGEGRKREFTEEETRRYEEMKARKKERQKERRKEIKEKKRVEKEEGTVGDKSGKAAAGKAKSDKAKKGAAQAIDQEASLVASTSALTIDQSPAQPSTSPKPAEVSAAAASEVAPSSAVPSSGPPRPPRQSRFPHPREAYLHGLANDPSAVPRGGGFWTHDQRHQEGGGEGGFRGRGGMRGGRGMLPMRGGRRRGFGMVGGRGGFAGPGAQSRQVELTEGLGEKEQAEVKGSGSKLAMDREVELEEARRRARAAAKEQAAKVQPAPAPAAEEEVVGEGSDEPTERVLSPERPVARGEKKWGHEAFEAVQAQDTVRSQMGPARGLVVRGRARGRGFGLRGGHLPFAPPHFQNRFGPVPPRPSVPVAAAASEKAAAISVPAAAAKADVPSAQTGAAEDNSTQPAAEALLSEATDGSTGMVKVRLPGKEALPDTPSSSHAAPLNMPPSPAPQAGASGPTPSSAPDHPAQPASTVNAQHAYPNGMHHSSASPAPFPPFPPSENGSMSSAGAHPAFPAPQNFLPPGVGMGPNGEYYNLSTGQIIPPSAADTPTSFYPSHRSYPAGPPQAFYPQAYSPDPYTQQQRSSYGGQQSPAFVNGMGYDERASSPFGNATNPYAQVGGYFAPARQGGKIAIRAPGKGGAKGGERNVYANVGNGGQQYMAQAYNPYVQQAAAGGEEAFYGVNGEAGYVYPGGGQMNGQGGGGANGYGGMNGYNGGGYAEYGY